MKQRTVMFVVGAGMLGITSWDLLRHAVPILGMMNATSMVLSLGAYGIVLVAGAGLIAGRRWAVRLSMPLLVLAALYWLGFATFAVLMASSFRAAPQPMARHLGTPVVVALIVSLSGLRAMACVVARMALRPMLPSKPKSSGADLEAELKETRRLIEMKRLDNDEVQQAE